MKRGLILVKSSAKVPALLKLPVRAHTWCQANSFWEESDSGLVDDGTVSSALWSYSLGNLRVEK
jgi:hypothetical protein